MRNRKRSFGLKLASVILSAVLIFSAGALPGANAQTLEELRDEYERLEQQIKENEKKLNIVSADKNEQEAKLANINSQLNDLDSQMSIINSRMGILNSDIGALNTKIAEYEKGILELDGQIQTAQNTIAQKEKDMAATIDKLCERLRASYISGNGSELEILLSSGDLSAFLTRSEMLRQVADSDSLLIEGLKADKRALEKLSAELDKDKEELKGKRALLAKDREDALAKKADVQKSADELGAKQQQASEKYNSVKEIIKSLDKSSEAYKKQIRKIEEEQRKADAAIDDYIRRYGSNTGDEPEPENDGAMAWPVPYSNSYISANFGYYDPWDTGTQTMHWGIDICVSGGSYGKRIVAAQGGEVILSGWNGGFGNNIVIDHGGGLSTRYAHCSSLLAVVGKTVEKGEVIAYIGSTGNSTGPHLHFEVRIKNGNTVTRVNPLNYVSRP